MNCTTRFALSAMLAAASVPQPAHAQAVSAEQAIEQAQDVYGPVDNRAKPACPPQKPGGDIVVCGEKQDQEQFRVKSSAELDPTGAGAKDPVPRAPDLETKYPGPVVARGCFIPPCPPPQPVIIDLSAIPEAPAGSDADRVGQGLAPLGRDPASPAAPPPPAADDATKPPE